MNSIPFSSLGLSFDMLKSLESLGYEQMTPIQAKSLPCILNNQDIVAKANTGSGKTAAFGLGLLAKIADLNVAAQGLVLCPTRELADQVSKEIRRLARFTPNIRVLTLCGGKPFRMQAESIRNGAHIIVGTPGRVQDHIERKTLHLKHVQTFVLDEADRMLDMGFYDNIVEIIKRLPSSKQTLLFSATYPNEIAEISQLIQKNPIEITIESKEDIPDITQLALQVREHEKNDAVISLLAHYNLQSTIIFCKTKAQCDDVAIFLCEKGFHALAIHSDFEQKEREEVLLQFANRSCAILVATDVAARGLDIKDLPLVINYDLPSSPEMYIHRIGRTGRGGKSGVAVSLYAYAENFKIEAIEAFTQTAMAKIEKDTLMSNEMIAPPLMRTLCIHGGKKNKIRPADILGALTGDGGLTADQVGKIDIFDFHSYVAIHREVASKVLNNLQDGKIKGRNFKMRYL